MTAAGKKKIAVLIALFAVIALAWPYAKEYASLELIQQNKAAFEEIKASNPVLVPAGYFALYTVSFALALPIGAILTLLGGALFGLIEGVILVSFGSSIGALFAFLLARFLFGKSLQEKYGDKLRKVNEGMAREGGFYLFTMRLIPAFPPALINILMGLTKIRALTFYWISQLGMLPGTIVYINAGRELGELKAGEPILSVGLIVSFVALGVFPLAAKKTIDFVKRKKTHQENA